MMPPAGTALVVRREAVETVLKWFPAIKRVANVYEVDTADPVNNSSSIVKSTLRAHPDLKAVVCTWGMPGRGGHQAITEMGKQNQVSVVCTDADRPVLRRWPNPVRLAQPVSDWIPNSMGSMLRS